ncbi:MAG: type II toxin-antitoxin system VapB family antitoxin [Hyphomicrobium sp.]|nr:type II toxin-antitoxin system VapB family antitoxin [Hyphomicrobium sp.]
MGRTNIDLDDELVDEAMKIAGVTTKREAVNKALEKYVRPEKSRASSLSRYAGQFEFAEGFDPLKQRRGRDFSR